VEEHEGCRFRLLRNVRIEKGVPEGAIVYIPSALPVMPLALPFKVGNLVSEVLELHEVIPKTRCGVNPV
jgi:hypothetical protein